MNKYAHYYNSSEKKKKLVISGHCLSQKTLVLDDFAQTLQIGMGL